MAHCLKYIWYEWRFGISIYSPLLITAYHKSEIFISKLVGTVRNKPGTFWEQGDLHNIIIIIIIGVIVFISIFIFISSSP
jgi:ABC-type multidrug transport system permease subunit